MHGLCLRTLLALLLLIAASNGDEAKNIIFNAPYDICIPWIYIVSTGALLSPPFLVLWAREGERGTPQVE